MSVELTPCGTELATRALRKEILNSAFLASPKIPEQCFFTVSEKNDDPVQQQKVSQSRRNNGNAMPVRTGLTNKFRKRKTGKKGLILKVFE